MGVAGAKRLLFSTQLRYCATLCSSNMNTQTARRRRRRISPYTPCFIYLRGTIYFFHVRTLRQSSLFGASWSRLLGNLLPNLPWLVQGLEKAYIGSLGAYKGYVIVRLSLKDPRWNLKQIEQCQYVGSFMQLTKRNI